MIEQRHIGKIAPATMSDPALGGVAKSLGQDRLCFQAVQFLIDLHELPPGICKVQTAHPLEFLPAGVQIGLQQGVDDMQFIRIGQGIRIDPAIDGFLTQGRHPEIIQIGLVTEQFRRRTRTFTVCGEGPKSGRDQGPEIRRMRLLMLPRVDIETRFLSQFRATLYPRSRIEGQCRPRGEQPVRQRDRGIGLFQRWQDRQGIITCTYCIRLFERPPEAL